ncbi:hypothetical protein K8I85_08375 [bacterium]|nr:hypothetical protein [bacterium]
MAASGIRIALPGLLLGAALALAGCGGAAQHLAVSHRHTPGADARIVVLPVELPDAPVLPPDTARTVSRLYATELLRAYEVLDYDRLLSNLATRNITLEALITGQAPDAARELGVDGVLQCEVYRWEPGKPGFWFLAKPGQVGFHAHLVDVRTGSVIWSVNRVRPTRPDDTLAVGLGPVFEDLAAEMPSQLTPY